MKDPQMLAFSEAIDRLMIVDVRGRATINQIYSHARDKQGEPLAMLAARKLIEALVKGSVVLVATGWPCRPWVAPGIGETDGPPGAVAIARSLSRAIGAVPVILCEPCLIEPMSTVCKAGGFYTGVSVEQAIKAVSTGQPVKVIPVLDFPVEPDVARIKAKKLLDDYHPKAVIVIEKGGMNHKGYIHTSKGFDTTAQLSKVDILVSEAKARGVVTIGIGDVGNEVGMGLIRDEIRAEIPYGAKCQCPCGAGIAPEEATDVLITASISNWGAYALSACMALLTKRMDVTHSSDVERRLLWACVQAGLIDGGSGHTDPAVDGVPENTHLAYVTMLGEIVSSAIKGPYGSS